MGEDARTGARKRPAGTTQVTRRARETRDGRSPGFNAALNMPEQEALKLSPLCDGLPGDRLNGA
jgi:hypothetical protein